MSSGIRVDRTASGRQGTTGSGKWAFPGYPPHPQGIVLLSIWEESISGGECGDPVCPLMGAGRMRCDSPGWGGFVYPGSGRAPLSRLPPRHTTRRTTPMREWVCRAGGVMALPFMCSPRRRTTWRIGTGHA